jgi:catechol 2,3-dioxygenase-like lactoylglutathione lyase family enzyme
MSLYIGSIVIRVSDVPRAVAFWCGALGYVVRGTDNTTVAPDVEWAVLTDPRRRWANISLGAISHPQEGRNRLHLDLYTQDREAEVARLEALGAVRMGPPFNQTSGGDFVVLADPDGNEFCVVQSPYTRD